MVTICDVTLRDGLQSIEHYLSVEQKLEVYKMLMAVGVNRFEYTSFVSPSVVPQLRDASEFTARLLEQNLIGKFTTSLVLNLQGAHRALASGSNSQTIVTSASEPFSIRNSGQSFQQLDLSIPQIVKSIVDNDGNFRGSISMVFGESGDSLHFEKVLHYIGLFNNLGAYEVSLADTTGCATVSSLNNLLDLTEHHFPEVNINLHLHGQDQQLFALAVCALERGVKSFDLSLLGVGGCPNVDHHLGNISYLSFVAACDHCGIPLSIDREKLRATEQYFSKMTC